jgi:hypothetical protein
MQKITYILFITLLFNYGCKADNGTPNDPVNPDTPQVTYAEVPIPPTVPAIDDSDYTIYYVDSGMQGNDNNDGLSPDTPFKTLNKVTNLEKKSKMKILFKSGATFTSNLTLKDLNGTPDKPFVVDIYGGAERPTFSGSGDQVVLIQDDNIRFRNIRITNKNGIRGIRVQAQAKGAGAFRNVEISGCRIEEVNWAGSTPFVSVDPAQLNVEEICSNSRFNKEYGGIILEAFTPKEVGPSWFENFFITNNEIFQVARTGILLATRWGQRDQIGSGYNEYTNDEDSWFPSKNVIIQGNDISYVGGDGVILMGSTKSFIDHNRSFYANFLGRSGHASAGLWPYCCTDIVMQFNEAAYTAWAHGSADGEGLDVDVACKNTLVQYNYIHHNAGGGLLMCNLKDASHEGSIVRNNVFLYNDGQWKGSFMTISSGVGSAEIYNNTVIVNKSGNAVVLYTDDWANAGHSHDIRFRNNIFVSANPAIAIFNHSEIDNCIFDNNLFYRMGNFTGMDARSLNYDPKIAIPATVDGYDNSLKCRPFEPRVLKEGIVFDGMSEKDMAGNPVKGISYLGAFAK